MLFVIVRGLPGSGKTSVVDRLVDLMPSGFTRLDPDAVDLHSKEFKDFELSLLGGLSPKAVTYRFLLRKAERSLKEGTMVVWEQPWRSLDGIQVTIDNLTLFTNEFTVVSPLKVVVVEIAARYALAYQRVMERHWSDGRRLSPERFTEYYNSYEQYGLRYCYLRIPEGQAHAEAARQIAKYLITIVV